MNSKNPPGLGGIEELPHGIEPLNILVDIKLREPFEELTRLLDLDDQIGIVGNKAERI